MQRDPAPLSRADLTEIVTVKRARLMWPFCFKISLRKSIAPLDAAEDVETRNRSRYAITLDPGKQRLVVEGLVQMNDGAVELSICVAEPPHMVGQRVLKARRILCRLK